MKTKLFCLSALCAALAFTSCKEDGPEAPKYADVPFETISLQADGETSVGTVDGQNITFKFKTAEDFSSARLILDVNEGWTLLFPADPDNYDVSTDPNIYFQDPKGGKLQYNVSITSDALPIIDGSKVSVEGGYAISYNIATKSFSITYADGMKRSEVTLVFGQGSLMDGAEVMNATIDLSEGPAVLKIKLGETVSEYPVSIDYSSVLVDPKSWGFADETADDLKAKYPSLKVLKASALSKQVPVKNAGAETQQWWNHAGTYESQIANCGLLGDYAADRQTVEVTSCDFTIVTFNEADFKGRIVADANSVKTGIGAETVSAAITMSGCPAAWTAWVKSNNKILSWESASWWEGVKAKGTSHGLMFGFNAEGKLVLNRIAPTADALHTLGFRKASEVGLNYNELLNDANFGPYRADFTTDGPDWNVTGAAYFTPALVVDGYKVRFMDVMLNNGDSETIGQGYNGERARCFIGRTIDNKIGLACIDTKTMTIMQGAYVLADLGWIDVYYVGGDNYQADSYLPTIAIDGTVICGAEAQAAKYVVAFDKK